MQHFHPSTPSLHTSWDYRDGNICLGKKKVIERAEHQNDTKQMETAHEEGQTKSAMFWMLLATCYLQNIQNLQTVEIMEELNHASEGSFN